MINNGIYGAIRTHQEREFLGRTIGTQLTNPDFAACARSFGAHGETVTHTEQLARALDRCMKCGKPSLIEVELDPEAITPSSTLASIRDVALKSKAVRLENA